MQSVEQLFQDQCDCFALNDLARMSRSFAIPMAIYFGEQIMVFKNLNAIESALSAKRTALRHALYARSSFRIIAQPINPRKHLTVWVEFRHYNNDDSQISSSISRYFCVRHRDTNIRIQLIEYLQTPQLDFAKNKTGATSSDVHHFTVAPA